MQIGLRVDRLRLAVCRLQEVGMRRFLNRLLSLAVVLLVIGGSVRVDAAAVRGTGKTDMTLYSLGDESDGDTESNGPVGFWKLTEMKGAKGKDTMTKEEMRSYEELGVAMYIELREDNTVLFSLLGEEMYGAWDDYGIILDNDWLTYSVKDDELTLKYQDGGRMVFKRTTRKEIYKIIGYKKGVLDEDVSYSTKEKTILDTDAASVVITGYKADMTGFTVYLRCSNKTRHDILISETGCAVNRYIFNPDWTMSLEKKEVLDSEMKFAPEELEKCGISVVEELCLELKVTNSVDDSTLQEGILARVHPTHKKAEDIKAAERSAAENETVVLDNENCVFVVQGIETNDVTGCTVNCYVMNKTDRTLTFMWSGETVNDQAASAVYSEVVLAGTQGYSKAVFMKSTLDDIGIDSAEISKINAVLKVIDNSKGDSKVIAEKAFTYTP